MESAGRRRGEFGGLSASHTMLIAPSERQHAACRGVSRRRRTRRVARYGAEPLCSAMVQQSVLFDPVVDEIVRRAVGAFEPDRIILFGSRARGNHHDESDYDVMFVVNQSMADRDQAEKAVH